MRLERIFLTIGMFSLAAPSAGLAGANLVSNGNFATTSYSANNEFGSGWTQTTPQGVTGWTGNGGYNIFFFNGTATTVSANSQYASGKEMLWATSGFTGSSPHNYNFVALDGEQTAGVQGSISQTVNGLVAGQTYSLTFEWAAGQLQSRNVAVSTTEQLQVSVGSETQTTNVLTNPANSFTGWYNAAMTFTATASSEVLNFLSVGTPSGDPPMALLTNVSLTKVPEPATLAVFGVGMAGIAGARLRRR
jgi:hypothetical protein